MNAGDRVRLSAKGRNIFINGKNRQGLVLERTAFTIPHCERVQWDGYEPTPNLDREFLEVVT